VAADGRYGASRSAARTRSEANRREPAALRAVGGAVAILSGPMWAYAIARSVVEMDRDVIDHLDEADRVAYAVYWLLLTSLMFFGATVGYFALRAQRWSVLRALRLQQLVLVVVAAAALVVATFR
jgi:hypothetical protein